MRPPLFNIYYIADPDWEVGGCACVWCASECVAFFFLFGFISIFSLLLFPLLVVVVLSLAIFYYYVILFAVVLSLELQLLYLLLSV